MATGKIKTLFSDVEKTEPLFPRTKTSAISDADGIGLDVIIENLAYTGDGMEEIQIIPFDADTLGGLPAANYATQSFVTSKIAEAQLGGSGNEINLSGYATKDDLATKAPSGYGLGDAGTWMTNLDDAINSGFYAWTNTAQNIPFDYGVLLALRRDANRATQISIDPYMAGHGAIAVRHKNSDGWYPWEYVNPPMSVGVEYRTTERYMGKTVFAKLVNFGALPNKSNKNVGYRSNGSTGVVSLTGMLSDGCCISAGYNRDRSFSNSYGIYLDNTLYNIRMLTDEDFSSLSAYVLVKYTID